MEPRRSPRMGLTYQERVVAMEQRLDASDGRLVGIESKVDEIHTLLLQAKGIIWLGGKIFAWVGGVVAIAGGITLIVRFFTGH